MLLSRGGRERMPKNSKQQLGQFYTKNAKYIIQDLLNFIPFDIQLVIDPFAGEGDLLDLVDSQFVTKAYDITPKLDDCIKQDTLMNPPKYDSGMWIITNPPYLAKNKAQDKTIYEKYQVDDLYVASLKSFEGCRGGIIILPAGFLTNSDSSFRKSFLQQYVIKKIYIFEEKVFSDTDYTICSFVFEEGNGINKNIETIFMPNRVSSVIYFNDDNDFTFGGEIFKKKNSAIKISRLREGGLSNSNIKLYAIDSGTEAGKIRLTFEEPFFGKNTDRAFATMVFSKNFSADDQHLIINKFNERLDKYRTQYNSMFLTNYRNSTSSGGRKRIGFEQAYILIGQVIDELGLS